MLKPYANQSLLWERGGDPNVYNERTFTSATIKGRKEPTSKIIISQDGEQIVTSSFVVTASAVSVNDKIDSRLVISSEPMYDLNGKVLFYEVYLR